MIRPFQLGDIFLIQRLGRQATKLNTIQSLLQPQSASWASLSSVIPWNGAKVTTCVLRQQGHGLVGVGFLQAQKRPGRPEVDIVRVAPGIDAPLGHPAIWEKLLSHHNSEATQQQVERIYVDAPDQPLPVSTFCHVGFRTYVHQTIWRLLTYNVDDYSHLIAADIRPQTKVDEWALKQLYRRTIPESIQIAEGVHADNPVKPPILEWWHPGACSSFVLVDQSEIKGSLQVVQGARGYWLQLWADMLDSNPYVIHQLVRFGLTALSRRAVRQPVYIGVCDYQGALGAILSEYGFAPFTDRAKMVKHVMQWVREASVLNVPVMESTAQVVAAPFRMPGGQDGRARPRIMACHHGASGVVPARRPMADRDLQG